MPDIAFLNEKFLPLDRAMVSVEDRGFQFGDGVYELIRAYGGRLFHVENHIRRLLQSLDSIQLPGVYPMDQWRSILEMALEKSGYTEAKIYLQVTRGVSPRQHPFPEKVIPTVVVTVRKMDIFPEDYQKEGVSVITMPDLRWARCDVKSINLLPNILAKQKAKEEGALEALFIRDGQVQEGAGSNVFSLKGDRLITPAEGNRILSGVTRGALIGLAKAMGLQVFEEDLELNALYSSDEVLLTATSMEILPVVRIDKKVIGSGKPGPIQKKLYQDFLNGLSRYKKGS
ncbi:MAG TPA: D-amino-acid transaminase [Nitrospiria bacterium]|jgi:D-alanine transaminase